MFKTTAKLFAIGLIGLILLILTLVLYQLTNERISRRDDAIRKTASIWGHPRIVGGPVMVFADQYLAPTKLHIEGALDVSMRHRGIFKIPFYTSQLTITGTFPAAAPKGAALALYLTRGEPVEVLEARFDNQPLYFQPSGDNWLLQARIPVRAKPGSRDFSVKLRFAGIKRLRFLPAADLTTVRLQSNWADPNFCGASLPVTRKINETGFVAEWSARRGTTGIKALLRTLPRAYSIDVDAEDAPAFGVDLFVPVDIYHRIQRSLKYSVLIIGLTFMAFFLFELMSGLRVHPMQYLFVGFALCIFYLLLLSIAEHFDFLTAYLLASGATVGLVSAYSYSVLRARTRAGLMAGLLGGLYAFLFVLLQSESYSLLMGSVGLFVILGFLMYVTRNMNWYDSPDSAG